MILVIDAGTSGIRAAAIDGDAHAVCEIHEEVLPDTPADGLVEFDARRYADVALDLARRVLAQVGPVDGVGISNQRGSTVVWDRATGEPVAPAQGWQDLRTVGDCLVLAADGIRFAPNQEATKIASIWNSVDPERTRDLCAGSVDSWLIWNLSGGTAHATDLSNATISGLALPDGSGWNTDLLAALSVPEAAMPSIVDSSGAITEATVLDGSPVICGVAGDQQASMVGQGCVEPGMTKITFGTGGMLDVCLGDQPPATADRGPAGTFPIVCWRRDGSTMWGAEAIMLSAGTNVQWLRDDLGLIDTLDESDSVAAACDDTGGVMYVPAQLGLGTPHWDYGARGTLLGMTRGTGRPEVVRAVLEGVAQRGADLVEAAESDTSAAIDAIRVDGGWQPTPPSPSHSPMPPNGESRSPQFARPPPEERPSWPDCRSERGADGAMWPPPGRPQR